MEGGGSGYLKTVCDYVHLNPVRAKQLKPEERLPAFPGSSLVWYVAASEHRPGCGCGWIGWGEHGIQQDRAAGRQEFERRMEARRWVETDEGDLKALRHGWCLGSKEFKEEMLEKMEGKLGDNHSGEQRRETAQAKVERIIREELSRLGWQEGELATRRKNDPGKLAIAGRLRKETTLTIKNIAARVHLGSSKSANARLHEWLLSHPVAE